MDNRNVSQQEPSGFFVGSNFEDCEKPSGFSMGYDVGSSWEPKNNLIHSHSHKLPKAPSQGEGFSGGDVRTTVEREPGSDDETPPPGLGKEDPAHGLRPYQAAAVQALRLGLAGGALRLMLASPTGSGKTEMGMSIIKGAKIKGKRVAFLANRIHLVDQARRRFYRSGINCGVIQGANTRGEWEQVVVCSIQTVAKRGMPDCDLIVIDEAHATAGSAAYRKVIELAQGKPVIGLSATPFSRGLGKHYDTLGGPLFEQMIIAATISELIDDGYLVDADIYAPGEPDMTGIKQVRNSFGELDWSDMDVGQAADKPELIGDIVSHWLKLANGTPTVCFASNIAHSKHIVEQFLAVGVTAEHIDCYTDEDERKAILERVTAGRTTVISNVGILCEGWDFPACKTLILARPTNSLIRYIQMAGRVLRPFEGKERALILDHSGTVKRLGFPTDEMPMELDDGKPKKASQSKPKEKLPKACPKCSYLKIGHKCPQCGFAPEKQNDVHTADGELVKQERGEKKPKATHEEKQRFYSELLAIQTMRGYSDGWVSHTYKKRFEVWPKGMHGVACEPSDETKRFVQSQLIRHAKGKKNAK